MSEPSSPNCCVIELHYCLKDDSHSMDAFIFNECEREFLAIVRNVARRLGVNMEVRTEALRKGGILCCFTIGSPEFWSSVVDIIQIVCIILQTPGAREAINDIICGVIKLNGKSIERQWWKKEREIAEEKRDIAKLECETAELERETAKSKYETAKYECITEELYQYIDKNIEKSRSNFYANLLLCDTVEGLTIRATDGNGAECFPEKRIAKDDFKGFIMSDNEVMPEYVNDAEIKIIPPIDIEGRHKWFGEYKDEPIRFDMRSNDFKKALQRGRIRIEDIVSIRCNLEIRRKIDKEYGDVVSKGYRVMDVIDY